MVSEIQENAVLVTPFEQARKMEKRLKLLIFGDYGEGKTWLALHFPKPVLIDMERGADLYGDKFEYGVMRTTSPDEIYQAIQWLYTNRHSYKTLILDPISVYWEAVQSKWQEIFMKRNPTSRQNKIDYWDMQFSDWGPPKAEFAKLLRLCGKLDMNVIVTAGIKPLYSSTELMKKIGDTFDGPKELPKFFDTTVRLIKDSGKFYGTCEDNVLKLKDRNSSMPKDVFELTSDPYAVFKKSFGDVLEKDCEPVTLLTAEQKVQIEHLAVDLKVTKEQLATALKKLRVDAVNDLSKSDAAEIIKTMQAKLTKQKAEKTKETGDGSS